MSGERELALRLAGTAESRRAAAERIAELAARADYDSLARILDLQLLLPLGAHRLEQAVPGAAPGGFQEMAERQTAHWRRLSAMQAAVTVTLLEALGRAGIAAAPLKGPLLAEAVHGDGGLRYSSDIDLLVDPEQLADAVDVLRGCGYGPSADLAWQDGRPLLHHALPPERSGLPPLDLHWRIHWGETELSRELLASAVESRLRPADEIVSLLLFFARNSFAGLRLAADLSAFWDRHRESLGDAALEPLLTRRPELGDILAASALVAERLVGLPAARLLGQRSRPGRRALAATRLADWEMSGSEGERTARMTAIDWLLTPPRQWRSFARRHLFQPAEAIARSHGRPPGRRIRNEAWRIAHGSVRSLKFAFRYVGVRRAAGRKDRLAGPLI